MAGGEGGARLRLGPGGDVEGWRWRAEGPGALRGRGAFGRAGVGSAQQGRRREDVAG